jgi:FkbM family methyltransferase
MKDSSNSQQTCLGSEKPFKRQKVEALALDNPTQVSLIVPTLRRPDYLLRCLSSLALQTERPTEVLVGIRANDDLSRPILRKFADTLEIKAVNAKGVGVVGAMNSCLTEAKGQLIGLVDDDVEFPPDWLETMIRHLDDHSDVLGAGGRDFLQDHPAMRRSEPHTPDVGRLHWFGRITGNHTMQLTKRFLHLLKMARNARRFGIRFRRRATFFPPSELLVNGRPVHLRFPLEEGVKWDFLTVFLEDAYGLASCSNPICAILDIGGNVGFFSVAAKHYFPRAVVHTYEPNPAAFEYAATQSRQCNFTLFAEAVGGHSGPVSLDFCAGLDSNLCRTKEDPNGSVCKIGLDEAIARMGGAVDLLKLDCEGAEWEMFAEAHCWKAIRELRMEYHLFNGKSHADLVQALGAIGFQIHLHRFDGKSHYGLVHAKNALLSGATSISRQPVRKSANR